MRRSFLPIMSGVSDKIVEKIKTLILCLNTSFRNSRLLCDNVGKYDRGGQVTDDNMTHTHSIPDNKGYKPHAQNMKSLLLFHCNNG